MAPLGRATQHSRDTRKTAEQSNQLSLPHQDDCKIRMDTIENTVSSDIESEFVDC